MVDDAPDQPSTTVEETSVLQKFPSVPMKAGETIKSAKERMWETTTKSESAWEKWKSCTWVRLLLVWLVAMVLLYLLHPPIVCKSNSRDDLDAYRCSPWRLASWAALAPLLYLILPRLGIK